MNGKWNGASQLSVLNLTKFFMFNDNLMKWPIIKTDLLYFYVFFISSFFYIKLTLLCDM